MKNLVKKLATAIAMVFAATGLSAQCEPDTVDCIDTGLSGEICPRYLPEATVNIEYDESITVIPPSEFSYSGSTIVISYITVDSVLNLPEGMNYQANASKFYPDTAYCVQIFGTPAASGSYPLSIYVSVFINLGTGPILAAQLVDDTSVVMSVNDPTGLNTLENNDFHVLPTVPNPFTESVLLGYYTPDDDQISLKVYNILGKLVHEEMQWAPPGEHRFGFDGRTLLPGTYFYRVTSSHQLQTGKFIKSR